MFYNIAKLNNYKGPLLGKGYIINFNKCMSTIIITRRTIKTSPKDEDSQTLFRHKTHLHAHVDLLRTISPIKLKATHTMLPII